MTAAQLAEQIPADDRTIFRYEATGKITSDAMARIVQVLRSNELRESYCRECPVRNVRFKAIKKRPRFKQGMSKIATLLYHGLVR